MASGDGRGKPRDEGSTKPLLDKLGVKRGMRVSVLGLEDKGFLAELERRTQDVATDSPIAESDLLFVGFRDRDDLVRLNDLQQWIKRDGAIWAVWRKGQQALKEGDIIAGALAAGLVDVKVVRFSETHSALKIVIPVARRVG